MGVVTGRAPAGEPTAEAVLGSAEQPCYDPSFAQPAELIPEPGADQAGVKSGVDFEALKKASVRGAAINLGTQALRFGLQFGYQIALARLLDPRDFGLVGRSGPVLGFVQLLSALGLSQATIQREHINQQELSFAFWLNAAVGAALAAVTILMSPLVGWFYGDPRVVILTRVSGSLFLLGGVYTQHLAILNRGMRFRTLAFIDLTAFCIATVVAIAAAYLGAGYWAIITHQVVTSVISLVLAWSTTRWRPDRPRRVEGATAMLRFGGNLTGFNLVNYFSRNLDNVLIGRFNGEVSLGLYDRAYKLLLLPLNQIASPLARVALPLLAKLRNDERGYRSAFCRLLEAVLLATYPGVVFSMIDSHELIRQALGAKWLGVAPIFSILAVGALTAPISNATGWLFITQDRTREMRNLGVASTAIAIVSFIFGLPWGPRGVAFCYIAAATAWSPVVWRAATRQGSVDSMRLARSLAPYMAAALVTGFALVVARSVLPDSLAALCAQAGLAYLVFGLVLLAFSHSRQTLASFASQLGLRRSFKRS